MTLALTVMYKCTSNCGKNKSSETVNLGGRATLYHSMSASVWTCTCKCMSLLFCNVNVYHFHSYHYCSIWHGSTVHNDMESKVLFFNISCRLVNDVTLKISYASSRNR